MVPSASAAKDMKMRMLLASLCRYVVVSPLKMAVLPVSRAVARKVSSTPTGNSLTGGSVNQLLFVSERVTVAVTGVAPSRISKVTEAISSMVLKAVNRAVEREEGSRILTDADALGTGATR